MTDKDLDNTLKECIESMVEYIRTVTKQTLIEAFQKKERANNPKPNQGSSRWIKAEYFLIIVVMILIAAMPWLFPIPTTNIINIASEQQGPVEIKELIIFEYILRFLLLAVLFIVLLKGYKYYLQHKKEKTELTIKNEQDHRAFIRFFLQHSSDTKQQEQKKKQ